MGNSLPKLLKLFDSKPELEKLKLLLLNGWMDFEIISQECSLRDSARIDETIPLHRTRWPPELKIEKALNNF